MKDYPGDYNKDVCRIVYKIYPGYYSEDIEAYPG